MTTLRTVLKGLAALATLAAIVAGMPWLLYRLGGSPIPSGLPTNLAQLQGELTRPDTGTWLIGVCKYLGWAAWLSLTGSILLELLTQARHIHLPRVPVFIGATLAARLVAAVLAIGALSAAATVLPAPPAVAATTGQHPGGGLPVAASTAGDSAPTTVTEQVPRVVTVAKGDTLSGIARREYHNANRWPQLYAANKGAPQPGGGRLRNPNLIQPGLRLTIPDKTDTVTHTSTPAPEPAPPPAANQTETPTGAAEPTPAPAAATPNPGGSEPTSAAGSTGTAPHDTEQRLTQTTEHDSDPAAAVRTTTGLGALAAAGVLVLLKTRRRRQSRSRRPGQRINLPTGAAAAAEAQLQEAADPLTVDHLDRTLRTLARPADEQGQTLPAVRAARISTDSIELYLVDEAAALPAPFASVEHDPGAWRIGRAGLDTLLLDPQQAAAVTAPYPTLVTLGHDDDNAHLLVNLEQLRTLAITGAHAPPVLNALTLELVACPWADDLIITLVGVLPELADALGSDRVTYVPDLEQTLTGLEYLTAATADAMRDAGVEDPTAARMRGLDSDYCTPHLIVTGRAPTRQQATRIRDLLDTCPRTALAALVHGEPLGPWQLNATAAEQVTLLPPQITLTPQRLTDDDLADLLDLFRAADGAHHARPTSAPRRDPPVDTRPPDDGPEQQTNNSEAAGEAIEPRRHPPTGDTDTSPGPGQPEPTHPPDTMPTSQPGSARPGPVASEPAPAVPQAQPPAEPAPQPPRASRGILTPYPVLPTDRPCLRLLGPVRVDNAPGKHPEAPGTALKILTHLALHPGGHHEELDQAVWPGAERRTNTRAGAVNKARAWLGTNPDGRPYLALWTQERGYRLEDDLPVDWTIFQTLTGDNLPAAPTQDLLDALHLVYGKPLTGPRIAETPAEAEMIAAIADVAHELADRALHAGDATQAAWAAGKGLDVEPVSEVLWRDLIRATHLGGDPERVREVIRRLDDTMEGLGDLEPETETLIAAVTHRTPART